jgi:DNA transposition AAA+ family ATPase
MNTTEQETYNPILVQQLVQMRDAPGSEWSNNTFARKLGVSSAMVSQYLNCKYPGDVALLEKKIEDFLRNEARRRASGVKTTATSEFKQMATALELVRKTNDAGEILAHSGDGKSRALELYIGGDEVLKLDPNPTAVLFHVRSWAKDLGSVEGALFDAIGKEGYDNRTKRAVWMAKKLRGSDRLIIVDDAHKLTRPALQFLFDFHDDTGCPMAFVGTFDLHDKLSADAQQLSRVGLRFEIVPKDQRLLITHLMAELIPGVNGESEELADLCEQVAAHEGCYRSVHKQLKLAVEIREGNRRLTWVQAFRSAHTFLIRNYKLV